MTSAPTTLRLRPDDLVRLTGSPQTYRVRSVDHQAGTVTLADMTGAAAGDWDVKLVRAVTSQPG